MASTLRSLGFSLVGGKAQLDLDKLSFERAVQSFGGQLHPDTVAVFYYAGHGIQLDGQSYLVPVSANISNEPAINAEFVFDQMESGGAHLKILLLDTSRNNPFGRHGPRTASGGFPEMQAPEGTILFYAIAPGAVASEGNGAYSPFAAALAEAIREPGVDMLTAFNEVSLLVSQQTHGQQHPWISMSPVNSRFYFASPATSNVQQKPSRQINQ